MLKGGCNAVRESQVQKTRVWAGEVNGGRKERSVQLSSRHVIDSCVIPWRVLFGATLISSMVRIHIKRAGRILKGLIYEIRLIPENHEDEVQGDLEAQ